MMIAQAEAQQRRHDYTPAPVVVVDAVDAAAAARADGGGEGAGAARRPHPERWAEYERLDLEQRAQRVADGVLLGPASVAARAEDLANLGVTAVVSLVDDAPARPPGVEWRGFPLPDASSAAPKLAKALPSILGALRALRARGHTVLLHCASGVSRSAAVAIALELDDRRAAAAADAAADTAQAADDDASRAAALLEAYARVFDIRPVICPNDGFFRALLDFAGVAGASARDKAIGASVRVPSSLSFFSSPTF